MGRVNIVKQVKVDGKWTLRSIPKKKFGYYDWAALPDGDYFVEWREDGRRRRQPAGNTAAQAMEEQRRKRHAAESYFPFSTQAPRPVGDETRPQSRTTQTPDPTYVSLNFDNPEPKKI